MSRFQQQPEMSNNGSHVKEEEEEIIASNVCDHEGDNEFDAMIGALQDILMQEEFAKLQQNFGEKYCDTFDDTDENKLVYTEIFDQYTQLVEDFLEQQMREKLGSFEMSTLIEVLQERKDEMTEDVLDMLMSLADFEEFKHFMLSHKQNGSMNITLQGNYMMAHDSN